MNTTKSNNIVTKSINIQSSKYIVTSRKSLLTKMSCLESLLIIIIAFFSLFFRNSIQFAIVFGAREHTNFISRASGIYVVRFLLFIFCYRNASRLLQPPKSKKKHKILS